MKLIWLLIIFVVITGAKEMSETITTCTPYCTLGDKCPPLFPDNEAFMKQYFIDSPTFSYHEAEIDFYEAIEFDNNKSISTFEFCPDGVCEIITINGTVNNHKILDFGVLYLYYLSENSNLQKWRENSSTKVFIKNILHKYKCDYQDDREKALCAMKNIAGYAKVSLFWGRYDEGYRCISEEPFSLESVKSKK